MHTLRSVVEDLLVRVSRLEEAAYDKTEDAEKKPTRRPVKE